MSEEQQTPRARVLFKHVRHAHISRNPNEIHAQEISKQGFNALLAVKLTAIVGSMVCAYAFALLAVVGFPLWPFGPVVGELVQWLSQTFIQLTMLSVIMVGQSVIGRKQEIQSEEQFSTTMKAEHNIEQIMGHLNAQDAELLKQTPLLLEIRDLLLKAQVENSVPSQ